MPRRKGVTPGKQRYPERLSVRISGETQKAIAGYIGANPGLRLTKSDVVDQALDAFFSQRSYWSDVAARLDRIKKELYLNRRDLEKQTEIILHFVRTFYYHVDGAPAADAAERAERFYRGFVKALNRLLKTHTYSSQLYTEDFDAALDEEADRATAREEAARRTPADQ